MLFSKFIWFWQAKRYLETNHTIVRDGTCSLLTVRADKWCPAEVVEIVMPRLHQCGYRKTELILGAADIS